MFSYIRFAEKSEDIHAIRVAAGRADLILGGDIVVAGTRKILATVKPGATQMVVNTTEFLPGDFTRNADFSLPTERLKRVITADAGRDKTHFIDATRLSTALFGQSTGTNIFLVGYAYQLGAIPLSAASIERAIELNGEAVAMNKAAFHWGRRAAIAREEVERIAAPAPGAASDAERMSQSLIEIVERRQKFLTDYQNEDYGSRYLNEWQMLNGAEVTRAPGRTELSEAVARNLFKLMAYKDEYEVARLYTDGSFMKQVAATFDGDNLRFEFHLAPPLLARRDKTTGLPRKMSFGPWLMPLFRALANFKFLRGTAFDPFGYTVERRTERKLLTIIAHCCAKSAPTSPQRTTTSPSRSRPSRKKSAASATSSSARSPPPRPKKQHCSTNSAPARWRFARRRSK